MRIQHNIAAMNSYRNYSNNVSAVSKNLEKLSSGYRINRAGDDAAGLAISEKMRAQITGLEAAQKNVKDGISLVKTAEGAMQEIQDMLNRMDYLATQSANGTYDNEVDRANLQKEVVALKDEINRIADSANFNGIKLLDGSLGSSGGVGTRSAVSISAASSTGKQAIADGTPANQISTATMAAVAATDKLGAGQEFSIDVQLTDGSSYSFVVKNVTADGGKFEYNGDKLSVGAAASNTITAAEMADLVKELLNKEESLTANNTIDSNGTAVTITAAGQSFDSPAISAITVKAGQNTYSTQGSITTVGKGMYKTLNIATLGAYDGSSATDRMEDHMVTINGQQFAFAKDKGSAEKFDSNVNVIIIGSGAAPAAADIDNFLARVNQVTGLNISKPASGTTIDMISNGGASGGGGLSLQIGDTADKFNKMTVKIGDMHTAALGINGVDISTQGGASTAIKIVKNAINSVSSVRGDLGAYQNRLEHTQKNLSVMAENIQDAESTIRDTDVANEMMAYTKNNILVQSAQAMLAQANQIPQGVLQLLG